MFARAIEKILEDHCSPAVVRAIESGRGSPSALWDSLADAGFLELLTAEEQGGAGLRLAEFFPILTTLGRYAMPLPIAQSIAARALLAPHGAAPAGMLTLAPACQRIDRHIVCPLTPFGMLADHVLADDDGKLLILPCAIAERRPTGVPRSLIATLEWPDDTQAVQIAGQGFALQAFAAAIHAGLISGALFRIFEMTLQYANDRTQFGKSIGKFQAIQHQISVMAEHVASASMAAEAAFQGDSALPQLLPSAMAKARTGEAAILVASIAHAVHGAIGVTEEYDLQLFTRRLHEWRMAHGSEDYWNVVVGRLVLASPLPLIADFIRYTLAPT
jgi:acyl-CoA dehydrogenase